MKIPRLFFFSCLWLALSHNVSAAPGTLDPTFGTKGVVFPNAPGTQLRIALQDDGKTVMANEYSLTRFTSAGRRDPGFLNGNVITTKARPNTVPGIAIQPDGKIVFAVAVTTGSNQSEPLVVRRNADGSPDPTFNFSGQTLTQFGSFAVAAIALQPDGKVVVAGTTSKIFLSGFTGTQLAVARYLPNGELDLSFHGNGQVTTSVSDYSGAGGLALQADGKILVCGASSSSMLLVRYEPTGQLDAAFGQGGIVIFTPEPDPSGVLSLAARGQDVAVQNDGAIIVGGTGGSIGLHGGQSFYVWRYTSSGVLDSTFGMGGFAQVSGQNSAGGFVALQRDGKIILAGTKTAYRIDYRATVVMRYTASGALDPSFGTAGNGNSVGATLETMALRRDGRIVVAGHYNDGTIFLARYYGETPPPSDLDASGSSDLVLFNPDDGQVQAEYLRRNTVGGSGVTVGVPPGWKLVKVTDFDGDGKPDYILSHPDGSLAVWYLDGGQLIRGALLPYRPAGWELAGVADFNGDSQPDLLLVNPTTRSIAIWQMTGDKVKDTFHVIQSNLNKTLPAGWNIAGVWDFNRDRQPDLVLYHPATRQTALWLLNGTTFTSQVAGPTITAGWTLAGVADFNADAQPDFLIFNPSTRKTGIWTLDGTKFVNASYLVDAGGAPTVQPAGWNIVAP